MEADSCIMIWKCLSVLRTCTRAETAPYFWKELSIFQGKRVHWSSLEPRWWKEKCVDNVQESSLSITLIWITVEGKFVHEYCQNIPTVRWRKLGQMPQYLHFESNRTHSSFLATRSFSSFSHIFHSQYRMIFHRNLRVSSSRFSRFLSYYLRLI
jgi:hypothetical protein